MIRVTAFSRNFPLGDLSQVDQLPGKFRNVISHQAMLNNPGLHVDHYRSKHVRDYCDEARALEVAEICEQAGLHVLVSHVDQT